MTEEQSRRKAKAIETFVKVFGGSFQKLGPTDIDYKIFDKDKKPIAYAEVIPRIRNIKDAYPLPVNLSRLSKLIDKRMNPVLIWSCDDGIIYARAEKLVGQVQMFEKEMTVSYEKQRAMKYVRFT